MNLIYYFVVVIFQSDEEVISLLKKTNRTFIIFSIPIWAGFICGVVGMVLWIFSEYQIMRATSNDLFIYYILTELRYGLFLICCCFNILAGCIPGIEDGLFFNGVLYQIYPHLSRAPLFSRLNYLMSPVRPDEVALKKLGDQNKK